jgi:hypothetical protein
MDREYGDAEIAETTRIASRLKGRFAEVITDTDEATPTVEPAPSYRESTEVISRPIGSRSARRKMARAAREDAQPDWTPKNARFEGRCAESTCRRRLLPGCVIFWSPSKQKSLCEFCGDRAAPGQQKPAPIPMLVTPVNAGNRLCDRCFRSFNLRVGEPLRLYCSQACEYGHGKPKRVQDNNGDWETGADAMKRDTARKHLVEAYARIDRKTTTGG